MKEVILNAPSEAETIHIGHLLASEVFADFSGIVYLQGTLGTGKTTLARSIIQGLGWTDSVKSPTYTLVELYEVKEKQVAHMDLYRLGDPEELEFIGIRDFTDGNTLCLIEWPENGMGILPMADLHIMITDSGNGRTLTLHSNNHRLTNKIADISKRQ
ncbi:tRNA (adenosine(37)-N6)-threonylcarbamoyltransferase complex ATPase subunit type 1 TsaE [Gynuella sp.]